MRYVSLPALALLLALGTAPEASAQLADSSGVYLALGGGYSTSSGLIGPAIAAGYRQQNGLEYGVGVALESRGPGTDYFYSSTSVGATAAYTTSVASRTNLRIEGTAGFSTTAYRNDLFDNEQRLDGTALTFDASARVSREMLSVGSVRLAPSVGVYASGYDRLNTYSEGFGSEIPGAGFDAGLQVGIPLSFRLLGTDVTLPLQTRISLLRRTPYQGQPWSPSTGLRIDF